MNMKASKSNQGLLEIYLQELLADPASLEQNIAATTSMINAIRTNQQLFGMRLGLEKVL